MHTPHLLWGMATSALLFTTACQSYPTDDALLAADSAAIVDPNAVAFHIGTQPYASSEGCHTRIRLEGACCSADNAAGADKSAPSAHHHGSECAAAHLTVLTEKRADLSNAPHTRATTDRLAAVRDDDKLATLTANLKGSPYSIKNAVLDYTYIANWTAQGEDANTVRTWWFAANLTPSDQEKVKNATTLEGLLLDTEPYLRGKGTTPTNAPLVMVGKAENVHFPSVGRVRNYEGTVFLRRRFARFDFQTFPLPAGYVINLVTVERVPGKFLLAGTLPDRYALLNYRRPADYPWTTLTLWDNPSGNLTESVHATWRRSLWIDERDPQPEMLLAGTFYVPTMQASNSGELFNSPWDNGMCFLRFVFTDNMQQRHVRLYRLGNSSDETVTLNGTSVTTSRKADIDANTEYDIRVNLLGTYRTRYDFDGTVRQYDDGNNKAAFLN